MVQKMSQIYLKIQDAERFIRFYQNKYSSYLQAEVVKRRITLSQLNLSWDGVRYENTELLKDHIGNPIHIGSIGCFVARGNLNIRVITGITESNGISMLVLHPSTIEVLERRQKQALSKGRKKFGMALEFANNFRPERFITIAEKDLTEEQQQVLNTLKERGWLSI